MVRSILLSFLKKIRTDRIMWSCGDQPIKQLFYSRREYKESDHRPVVSYFVVQAKKVDKVKREKILAEIYQVIPAPTL